MRRITTQGELPNDLSLEELGVLAAITKNAGINSIAELVVLTNSSPKRCRRAIDGLRRKGYITGDHGDEVARWTK